MKYLKSTLLSMVGFCLLLVHDTLSFAQETVQSQESSQSGGNPPASLEEMATQQIDTAKNLINMIIGLY